MNDNTENKVNNANNVADGNSAESKAEGSAENKADKADKINMDFDKEAILEKNIGDLLKAGEIYTREYVCLWRAGIITVRDITEKTESNLLAIRNFGKNNVRTIVDALKKYGLTLKKTPADDVSVKAMGSNTVDHYLSYSGQQLCDMIEEACPTEIFRYLNTELDNKLSDIRWGIANMDENGFVGRDLKETRQGSEYDKKRAKLFRLKTLDGLVVKISEYKDFDISGEDKPEDTELTALLDEGEKESRQKEKVMDTDCRPLEIRLQNVSSDFMKVKLCDLYFVDMLGQRKELERNSQPWFDEEYIAPGDERRIYVTAGKELDYKFYWHIMVVVETKEKNAEGKTVTKERVYRTEHDEDHGGFYVDDYFEREI